MHVLCKYNSLIINIIIIIISTLSLLSFFLSFLFHLFVCFFLSPSSLPPTWVKQPVAGRLAGEQALFISVFPGAVCYAVIWEHTI